VCAPQAFEALQLPTASWGDADAAKAAYRRLSVRWHPDKNPGDSARAQALFVRVAAAYHTLTTANFDYKRCAAAQAGRRAACAAGVRRRWRTRLFSERRGSVARRLPAAAPARGVRRRAGCSTHRHAHEPHVARMRPPLSLSPPRRSWAESFVVPTMQSLEDVLLLAIKGARSSAHAARQAARRACAPV
jgi:hypothetical protein